MLRSNKMVERRESEMTWSVGLRLPIPVVMNIKEWQYDVESIYW